MYLGLGLAIARGGKAGASGPSPALSLDFTSALDSRVTFTRASEGWSYDSAGTLVCPQNLALQSGDLASAGTWTVQNLTAAGTITGPDGTAAKVFVPSEADSTAHRTFQTCTNTAAIHTLSYYAKAVGYSWLKVRSDASYANFDLTNGVTGVTNGTSTIQSVGSGWYRCTLTATIAVNSNVWAYVANSNFAGLDAATFIGDGTSGIAIINAQLQRGSKATTYIPTTTAAINGPRFDHGVGANAPGTNITGSSFIPRSGVELVTNGTFSAETDWSLGAGWSIAGGKLVATGVTGFAGASQGIAALSNGSMYVLVFDVVLNSGVLGAFLGTEGSSNAIGNLLNASGTYTFRGTLAAGETKNIKFRGNASFDGTIDNVSIQAVAYAPLGLLVEEQRANLVLNSLADGTNLATQSVTVTAVAHTLSFYGTGTVTLSGVSTAGPLVGTSATALSTLTFTPTAGSLTLTVTGTVKFANLEVGSFATSFIPTAGASVTRAADVASMTGTNFSSWYNQSAGTFVFVYNILGSSNDNYYPVGVSDGAGLANFYGVRANGSAGSINYSNGGGLTGINVVAGNLVKSSFAQTTNDRALVENAGTPVTSVAAFTMPAVTRLDFFDLGSSSSIYKGSGHIKSLTFYNTRLPNATLQSLTT
ncbi:MAG: hypothetical protein M3R04_07815 [bacterium]|nr:hypothetical protein [bacterium]